MGKFYHKKIKQIQICSTLEEYAQYYNNHQKLPVLKYIPVQYYI